MSKGKVAKGIEVRYPGWTVYRPVYHGGGVTVQARASDGTLFTSTSKRGAARAGKYLEESMKRHEDGIKMKGVSG